MRRWLPSTRGSAWRTEPLRAGSRLQRRRRARRPGARDARAHRRLGELRGARRRAGAAHRRHHPRPRHHRGRPPRRPAGRLPRARSAAIRDLDGALTLLPGHGPAGGDAGERAAAYLAHRAQRLDQVRGGPGSRATARRTQVVRRVYADVDESLWPAAELSVRAQLDYLGRAPADEPASAARRRVRRSRSRMTTARPSSRRKPRAGEVGQRLVHGLAGGADQLGQLLLGEVVGDPQAVLGSARRTAARGRAAPWRPGRARR